MSYYALGRLAYGATKWAFVDRRPPSGCLL